MDTAVGVSLLLWILQIFWYSLTQFVSLFGALVISGLMLGSMERLTNRLIIDAVGMKGVYLTAWLGTPVHELGHAAMCLLFRHKITGIRLLELNRPDGTMGYVTHAYRSDSLFQKTGNLFIGIAPLLSGCAAILVGMFFLTRDTLGQIVPQIAPTVDVFSLFDPHSWLMLGQMEWILVAELFRFGHFNDPGFWVFLFFSACVAARMSLSRDDIRGAWSGAGAMYLFLIIVNVLVEFLNPSFRRQLLSGIGAFNFGLSMLLGLAMFFSFIVLTVGAVLYFSMRLFRRLR